MERTPAYAAELLFDFNTTIVFFELCHSPAPSFLRTIGTLFAIAYYWSKPSIIHTWLLKTSFFLHQVFKSCRFFLLRHL